MFKTPVWTLELIRDTDAPFARVREALLDGPRLGAWHPVYRQAWGAEERIVLSASQDGDRTHLRLEAVLKGWAGFLRVPFFTWRVDHYLDRFVESL